VYISKDFGGIPWNLKASQFCLLNEWFVVFIEVTAKLRLLKTAALWAWGPGSSANTVVRWQFNRWAVLKFQNCWRSQKNNELKSITVLFTFLY
jgi:hypothetical protein